VHIATIETIVSWQVEKLRPLKTVILTRLLHLADEKNEDLIKCMH
jgi:hypothetical protein